VELDLELSSGRVHARRWGDPQRPLVLCVHGLTANLTAFSWLAEGLVRRGHQVVAIDCRGRGQSQITAPGTYGLEAHARDVHEITAQLGCTSITYIGWSMGALVGMALAQCAPELVQQLILLDHTGPMDPDAISLVRASLERLGAVVAEPDEYIDAVSSRGVIDPWTPFWTDHYRYELGQVEGGSWSPTTDRAACEEDLEAALRAYTELWSALTMPTTLVRAAEPIAGARLVSAAARAAFASAVGGLNVVEVPTNHYTVMTDPLMLAAVTAALAERAA
jgi:pimeloyl-ACP methyl ester carboxylesterase